MQIFDFSQQIAHAIFVLLLHSSICQAQDEEQDVVIKLRLVPYIGDAASLPRTSGILEFQLRGRWLRFCDVGWGRSESFVACGQLGFSNTSDSSSFEQNRQPSAQFDPLIRMRKVKCDMTESQITECKYQYTSHVRWNSNYCPSRRAVRLACQPPSSQLGSQKVLQAARKIRLRGGALVGEGRVQILNQGKWGEVCSNLWSIKAANVACRQLGFGTARKFYTNAHFGQNHGWKLLNNVTCRGSEASIDECSSDKISNYFFTGFHCSKKEIASVICFVPERGYRNNVRLLDGKDKYTGRVVMRNRDTGTWGSICSDHWTLMEATVVCRQMGLGFALEALREVEFTNNSSLYLDTTVTNVQCDGHEKSLDECQYDVNENEGLVNCGNGIRLTNPYVGVTCTQNLADLLPDAVFTQQSVKLESKTLHELECAASENCLAPSAYEITDKNSTRKLLRFSMSAWNRGAADYRPKLRPAEWIWHACHNHYHSMGEFAHYDILSAETLERAAEGHKASFCLGDTECDSGSYRQYRCTYEASKNPQGISVGCTDKYLSTLDCQWIDITDVEPGLYYLRVRLNPLRKIPESDFRNNEIVCSLTYTGDAITAKYCHIPDDFSTSRF